MSIKRQSKKIVQILFKTYKIMATLSYFRVKMISLKETDLSEANVAAQLGLPKS
jgi:hypothetical protein